MTDLDRLRAQLKMSEADFRLLEELIAEDFTEQETQIFVAAVLALVEEHGSLEGVMLARGLEWSDARANEVVDEVVALEEAVEGRPLTRREELSLAFREGVRRGGGTV
jgi:hypothetical protein